MTAVPSRARPEPDQPCALLRGQRGAAQRPSWLNNLWTPSLIFQQTPAFSLCSGPHKPPCGSVQTGREVPDTALDPPDRPPGRTFELAMVIRCLHVHPLTALLPACAFSLGLSLDSRLCAANFVLFTHGCIPGTQNTAAAL